MISAKMGLELSLIEIKLMFMKGHATKAQHAEAVRGYQTALEEARSPPAGRGQGLLQWSGGTCRRALIDQSHKLIASLCNRMDSPQSAPTAACPHPASRPPRRRLGRSVGKEYEMGWDRLVSRSSRRQLKSHVPVPSIGQIGGPNKLHPHRPSTPLISCLSIAHTSRDASPPAVNSSRPAQREEGNALIDPSPTGCSVGERGRTIPRKVYGRRSRRATLLDAASSSSRRSGALPGEGLHLAQHTVTLGHPRHSAARFWISSSLRWAICRRKEDQGAPATLHSPGASTGGPLPDAVTEEELMNSGHELHGRYTCPLCCLPIALPLARHSVLMHCCLKRVCNGCAVALHRRGMGKTCAFCRTPTPDSDAAELALIQNRVDAGDPVATEILASAFNHGSYGLQIDIPRATELWTEAARLGDLDAHCRLGYWYYKGEGVEKDQARGIQHWQQTAIQGHPESRHNLAVHEYKNGNHQLAVQHWMISSKMGYERSLNEIKKMFMKGHATKAQ
ncbi:hypothetical protein THAOC_20652, partial [Thalassiosira oceanica]